MENINANTVTLKFNESFLNNVIYGKPVKIENKKYLFKEISKDEAEKLYEEGGAKAFVIFKGTIYYSPIAASITVNEHKCASCSKYCPKFGNSRKIWQYAEFIEKGIETIGTDREQFVVKRCLGYVPMKYLNKNRKPLAEIREHIRNINEIMENGGYDKLRKRSIR